MIPNPVESITPLSRTEPLHQPAMVMYLLKPLFHLHSPKTIYPTANSAMYYPIVHGTLSDAIYVLPFRIVAQDAAMRYAYLASCFFLF